MKFARVFLRPEARSWVDVPIPDHSSLHQMYGQAMTEGVFVTTGAIVPISSVNHVLQIEIPDGQTNLTVFPGGKLN